VADADNIQQIHITQQVALEEELTEYDPLVIVKDLGCWPDRPNYAQLNPAQAKLLQENNINLESFWTAWPDIYKAHFGHSLPKIILTKGVDFDKVIYGISIGSLPHICPTLLAQDKGLQIMSEKVETVAT
jgi:uncharacterized protein with NAD-binding domain and iron-sulfur cluster